MNAAPLLDPRSASSQPGLLLCFSHLRWGFVFQRPQHLMTRLARSMPVVFREEPEFGVPTPRVAVRENLGVRIATPQLPDGLDEAAVRRTLTELLAMFLADEPPVAVRWYYTPMMLAFSRGLTADCTVYDCMDELSAFRFAPPELLTLEEELLSVADLVFTGGYSLYEAKRDRHPDVRAFPSSVDVAHFARARDGARARTGTPRFGFYGVVDERMDLDLLHTLAEARPDWSIEIVGPVVKIDPAELPQSANLHYVGARSYDELPGTVAG